MVSYCCITVLFLVSVLVSGKASGQILHSVDRMAVAVDSYIELPDLIDTYIAAEKIGRASCRERV